MSSSHRRRMHSTAKYSATASRRTSNLSQHLIGCMTLLLARGLRVMDLGLEDHMIGLKTGSKESWTKFVNKSAQRQRVIGMKSVELRSSYLAGMLEVAHTMLMQHGKN